MGDFDRFDEHDRRNTIPLHIEVADWTTIKEVNLLSNSKLQGLSSSGDIKVNRFWYNESTGHPSNIKEYHFSLYDKDRAWWNNRGSKHYVDSEYVQFLGEYGFWNAEAEYTKNNRTFDKLTETENGFIFLIRDTEKRTETKTIEDENGLPIEEVTETTYHYNYLQWNFQGDTYRENRYRSRRDKNEVQQWDSLLPVTDAPVAISETASNELKQNKDIDEDGLVGAASLTVGDNDVLEGSDANDTYSGGKGDDFIAGREGNDVLNGGKGNDLLVGGSGNDTINGGDGDDLIIAGSGKDVLTGGDGDDVFRIGGNGGRITDFDADEGDKIDLSALVGGGHGEEYILMNNTIIFTDSDLRIVLDNDGELTVIHYDPVNALPPWRVEINGYDSLSIDHLILQIKHKHSIDKSRSKSVMLSIEWSSCDWFPIGFVSGRNRPHSHSSLPGSDLQKGVGLLFTPFDVMPIDKGIARLH